MSGKQHAVMWLGLLLVITRMFTSGQWGSIWSTIGQTPIKLTSAGGATPTVRGGPVGGTANWSASTPQGPTSATGQSGSGVQLA